MLDQTTDRTIYVIAAVAVAAGVIAVAVFGFPNVMSAMNTGLQGGVDSVFGQIIKTPTDEALFGFDKSTGTITGYSAGKGTAQETLDVVIPAEIDGVAVTGIGWGAFTDKGITSVDIPASVTHIGNNAFQMNNLTSVDIPDGVTSISNTAFMYNNLTSVTIPDGVTSINMSAFYGNNLTSVDIPETVTLIDQGAFENNNLTEVTISQEAFDNLQANAFDDDVVINTY